jgi:DNA-binding MarR family transcriptional regulator
MKSLDCQIPEMATCKEIGRTCACFKVRKAARAITRLYEEVLRPSGLRSTQFSLLMAARVMGPVTVVNLAKVTVMDRTTLTRNLQILQKRRLITIKPGEDRRQREVNLTAAGMAALAKAVPLWRAAQDRVKQALGQEQLGHLMDGLSEMISRLKEK